MTSDARGAPGEVRPGEGDDHGDCPHQGHRHVQRGGSGAHEVDVVVEVAGAERAEHAHPIQRPRRPDDEGHSACGQPERQQTGQKWTRGGRCAQRPERQQRHDRRALCWLEQDDEARDARPKPVPSLSSERREHHHREDGARLLHDGQDDGQEWPPGQGYKQ